MSLPRNRSVPFLWLADVVANPPMGCAIFRWTLDVGGYGMVGFNGTARRAHRVAFELAYGPIPIGIHVLHGKDERRCESRACCNPNHLYLGTDKQNADDRARDGMTASGDKHWTRTSPEKLPRGKAHHWSVPGAYPRLCGDDHWSHQKPDLVRKGGAHHMAKLTDAQVLDVRRRRAAGETGVSVAATFGISTALVSLITNRKIWTHLP